MDVIEDRIDRVRDGEVYGVVLSVCVCNFCV